MLAALGNNSSMKLHYYQISQEKKRQVLIAAVHLLPAASSSTHCSVSAINLQELVFGEETQHGGNILGQGNADTAHFADYFLQFLVSKVDSKICTVTAGIKASLAQYILHRPVIGINIYTLVLIDSCIYFSRLIFSPYIALPCDCTRHFHPHCCEYANYSLVSKDA